ncbi:MAG: envelope stress response membrane protein PspB [Alphaproteobacteria bacterium]|nr:envelope stress response membrane protein PspB [Alphaproteobacteria bacterium]MBV9370248.1 envelope stress response membrane protein PspB [Alphaproteobacteria bacterium]MBV9899733.1 envelope stress response membrane protein PspB [Alphaproteobacteria bacterium]
MEDLPQVITAISVVGVLFLGLPWLIFHYITQWKKAATLTGEDEKLLEELHDVARRLDERLCSIERIMTAENPNWRAVACEPEALQIGAAADRTVSNQPRRIGQ